MTVAGSFCTLLDITKHLTSDKYIDDDIYPLGYRYIVRFLSDLSYRDIEYTI